MYHPTTRVLAVLELLQTHPRLSGSEIAERLEVDVRTARRYITMLQDLGIPVVAERGRYGAYALEPGFKLPPMMFTNDEALALTIGLLAAKRLGLSEAAPAVQSAQAKLERVIPLGLKDRVRALSETVVLDLRQPEASAVNEVMLTISEAAREKRRVHMHYRSFQSQETERDCDPYGLAYRQGRWYLVGHCHLRHGLRLFRVDRVQSAIMRDETFTMPDNFDILAHISQSIALVPRPHPVSIRLEMSLADAQLEIPADTFLLEQSNGGVLLRGSTDSLDWLAARLANLRCAFTIYQPAGLTEAIEQHALHLVQQARRTAPAG